MTEYVLYLYFVQNILHVTISFLLEIFNKMDNLYFCLNFVFTNNMPEKNSQDYLVLCVKLTISLF